MTRAVILAAGRGTRMRRAAPGVALDAAQDRMAAAGVKGLIPIHGRPYLDYVIGAVAEAGLREVCLVVGPGRHPILEHYARMAAARVRIRFAVQDEPLGSAHALLAAEPFAGAEPVLVLNADNYYPAPTLTRLCDVDGSALAGFRREVLITRGNIPPARVPAYAAAVADADGYLGEIVEKPGAERLEGMERDGRVWISMTCWRFTPSIFDACRAIGPSVRGEHELPDAVRFAMRRGERFRVVPADEPVLDLSVREDIPRVTDRLRGVEVRL